MCSQAQIKEGQICHADPEVAKYNYAGWWEKSEDGWVCNYWQFLPEDDQDEYPIEENDILQEEMEMFFDEYSL